MQKNKLKNKSIKSSKTVRNKTMLTNSVPFQITEAYKILRTNILFSLAASQNKVIAVSSARPGDGKSTTIANLAITLAQTGAKVVLIDADMRKPVQYKNFKVNNTLGLSRVLVGFDKLADCIKQQVAPGLDLLPSGPTPPNPAELLGSASMKELLDILQSAYDYVLIDTPPVNVVADALVLLNNDVDILLVGRQRQTTYEEFEKAINSIKMTNSNLIGVVVTSVRQDRKMYKSGNSYNYEYYHD